MNGKMRRFLALAAAWLVAVGMGRAATLTWDANGATAAQTDGAGVWLNAGQWWDGASNQAWPDGGDAAFGVGGAGGAVTLGSATNVNSLTFDYFTGTYTLGTAGNTITLSNGITMHPGVGTALIVSPITLGGAQAWVNNRYNSDPKAATRSVGATGGVDLNGNPLTIDGIGTMGFENTANVISGAGGIVKNGAGTLILGAAGASTPVHTYTGGTLINDGIVRFQATDTPGTSGSFGAGGITISNGIVEGYYGGALSRTLGPGDSQIQILGGASGFSGQGNVSTVFTLGSAGDTLQWGSDYFKPAVFVLQSTAVNLNGKLTLQNGIDLNGQTRTIASLGGDSTGGATITNGIVNNGGGTGVGLVKTGPGNLILQGNNTYDGATAINGGWLTLSGGLGALPNTSGINLDGGVLQMINASGQTAVNRVNDSAPIASAGGGITWDNASGNSVVWAETLGAITNAGGQLNIVESKNQTGTGTSSQTLTLSSLTRSGGAAVTFSALTTGPQAAGNKNMIVVTGGGTTPAGQIAGPWATVGTAANAQTDYAAYSSDYVIPAGIAASLETNWTSATEAYTVRSTEAKGATTLTATRNIAALRNNSQANAITADATLDTITLAGHTFVAGDPVVIGATAPGGLTGGVVYYVRDVSGDTFKVAATPGGAAINITSAGTPNIVGGLRLASGADLGTYGILNGVAAPLGIAPGSGGVVTLPSATSSNLYVTPGSSAITIAAPIVDNGAGQLTLVKSGSANLILTGTSTYSGDTIVNAGTLQLGINNTANGAKLGNGNYAGNIALAAGATLHIQTDAAQTLSGVISGGGNLIKTYSGTLTLGSNNTYSGKTSLTPLTTAGAGTLVVYSFNSVNGGNPPMAGSSLGRPTTVANGTIDFGSGSAQSGGTLRYTGPGETTDRVINFLFNGNGAGKTLEAAGSGLLKFTSRFTGSGSANNDITLTGAGDGEIVEGLAVLFRNLVKSGAGTWTLGGLSVFYGTTTIQGGTLAVNSIKNVNGGASALGNPTTIANGTIRIGNTTTGGQLTYTGTGDTSDRVINLGGTTGGATLDQSGTGLLKFNSNFTATGAGSKTLTLQGSTAGIGEIAGAIVDNSSANKTSLTKTGAGTWILSGANTYSGATTISNGTLLVNGSLASSVTLAGGTLGGSGAITGAVSLAGGSTLSPGNSPGLITLSGDLDAQAGSTMLFELAATNSFDRVGGLGDLSLAGAINVVLIDGFIPSAGNLFDLLDWSGTLTDNGYTLNTPALAGGLSWDASQFAVDGSLAVIPEPAAIGLIGLVGAAFWIRRRIRRG